MKLNLLKRLGIINFVIIILFSMSFTVASASENDDDKEEVIKETIKKRNLEDKEHMNKLIESEKVPSKKFRPNPLNSKEGMRTMSLTLYYSAECRIFNNIAASGAYAWTDSYSDEDFSKKYAIDKIKAEVRLYKVGALINSAKDENANASHAGAKTTLPEGYYSYTGTEAYGSHTCEESGYESWYPETYYKY